jgi:hypothetical protein
MRRVSDSGLPRQLQPQPPPQQPPPPPVDGLNDFAEAPLADPFVELKTDNWIEFCLLSQLGQAISCVLLKTIFSKWAWQSSQTYS